MILTTQFPMLIHKYKGRHTYAWLVYMEWHQIASKVQNVRCLTMKRKKNTQIPIRMGEKIVKLRARFLPSIPLFIFKCRSWKFIASGFPEFFFFSFYFYSVFTLILILIPIPIQIEFLFHFVSIPFHILFPFIWLHFNLLLMLMCFGFFLLVFLLTSLLAIESICFSLAIPRLWSSFCWIVLCCVVVGLVELFTLYRFFTMAWHGTLQSCNQFFFWLFSSSLYITITFHIGIKKIQLMTHYHVHRSYSRNIVLGSSRFLEVSYLHREYWEYI